MTLSCLETSVLALVGLRQSSSLLWLGRKRDLSDTPDSSLELYLVSLGIRGGHLRAKDTSEREMRVLSSILSFQKQVNTSVFSGKNQSVVSHWTLVW